MTVKLQEQITAIYQATGIISCIQHAISRDTMASQPDVPRALDAAQDILMRVASDLGTMVDGSSRL